MESKFHIFDVKSMNEELEKEFHNFFYKYGLTPLFTNEHRAGNITVSDNELRSVVNTSGKAHKVFLEFADIILMNNDNKSYEEIIFKLIYKSRSLQGLVNNIKKVMEFIKTIESEDMHNMWNIVFYNKELL